MGHEINPVRFDELLKFLSTIFDGPPKLLKKIVKYLQPTIADTL